MAKIQEVQKEFCSGCLKELDWHSEEHSVQLIESGNYYRFHSYVCVKLWADKQSNKEG